MATRKCPYCKGKKKVIISDNPLIMSTHTCRDCGGTGKQHQRKTWVAGDE